MPADIWSVLFFCLQAVALTFLDTLMSPGFSVCYWSHKNSSIIQYSPGGLSRNFTDGDLIHKDITTWVGVCKFSIKSSSGFCCLAFCSAMNIRQTLIGSNGTMVPLFSICNYELPLIMLLSQTTYLEVSSLRQEHYKRQFIVTY